MKKIYIIFGVLLLSGCIGQGVMPPMPKDTIELLQPEIEIISVDQDTGDVLCNYSLKIRNMGEDDLDVVTLKDFQTPSDVIMQENEFVIDRLKAGEAKKVSFYVTVLGGALIEKETVWEISFSIRVEIGSAYTEQTGFYYSIILYP